MQFLVGPESSCLAAMSSGLRVRLSVSAQFAGKYFLKVWYAPVLPFQEMYENHSKAVALEAVLGIKL